MVAHDSNAASSLLHSHHNATYPQVFWTAVDEMAYERGRALWMAPDTVTLAVAHLLFEKVLESRGVSTVSNPDLPARERVTD
jgi:hypothetical protein